VAVVCGCGLGDAFEKLIDDESAGGVGGVLRVHWRRELAEQLMGGIRGNKITVAQRVYR
jgi:hypothetical protein